MEGNALIIEDLPATRDWLAERLGTAFPKLNITTAGDDAAAQAFIGRAPALTLALVDLGLPDGSGIDLIRILLKRWPDVIPIVATIYDDDAHLFNAIAAGAQGYLLKSDTPEKFLEGLKRIGDGEPPLSAGIAKRMMAHFRTPVSYEPEIVLTPRETEVLASIGQGFRIRDVAVKLDLSEHTAGDHVKAIYRKLNISTRAEAALEAAKRKLI